MTKYISEVKTIEDSGTTGIRVTIKESTTGELEARVVNATEFKNIQDTIKKLQDEGITTTNLETYLKDYAKTTDIAKTYATKDELKGYDILSYMFVGRIKGNTKTSSGTPDWNFNSIEGVHSTHCHFETSEDKDHGFIFIVRPGGYTTADVTEATTNGIPAQCLGFKNFALNKVETKDHKPAVEKKIAWKDTTSGVTHEETCLVCPVAMRWTEDAEYGSITFNFKGRTITRLWTMGNISE